MKQPLTLTINGENRLLLVEPFYSLLDCLRDEARLTGAKKGCDEGDCGACTVLMDGKPVTSCLVLAHSAHAADITTIEGLAGVDGLSPVQKGVCGIRRVAVRVLHPRPDNVGHRIFAGKPGSHRGGCAVRHRRQPVPLHGIPAGGTGDYGGGRGDAGSWPGRVVKSSRHQAFIPAPASSPAVGRCSTSKAIIIARLSVSTTGAALFIHHNGGPPDDYAVQSPWQQLSPC